MPLRRGWVVVAALVLQAVAIHSSAHIPRAMQQSLLGTSYGLLLGGATSNLHLWGFRLLLVGLILNALAMAFHGWYMPVSAEALSGAGFLQEASLDSGSYLEGSKGLLLAREDTSLWFLTDILPLSKPVHMVFSVGDLIILLAVPLLVLEVAMRRLHPR